MAVARPSIVERRCWYSVLFAGDRLLAQLEDKVAGMTLVGAEHHGLRAIGIGLDQRVPTGAFTAAVATQTRSVQRADTVAPTEDLVGARHVKGFVGVAQRSSLNVATAGTGSRPKAVSIGPEETHCPAAR